MYGEQRVREVEAGQYEVKVESGVIVKHQLDGDWLAVSKMEAEGFVQILGPVMDVQPGTTYKVTMGVRCEDWAYGMFLSLQGREYVELDQRPVGVAVRTHPELRLLLPSVEGETIPRYLTFTTGAETRHVQFSAVLTGNPGTVLLGGMKLEIAGKENRNRKERFFDVLMEEEKYLEAMKLLPEKQGKLEQTSRQSVLDLGSQTSPPILYQRTYWDPQDSLHQMFMDAGVSIQVVQIGMGPYRLVDGEVRPGVWVGHGEYDFSIVDENIERALRVDPDIAVVVGVAVTPFADWGERYPDEVIQNEKGEKGVGSQVHNIAYRNERIDPEKEFWCPSLSSEIYAKDASEVLKALLEHMKTKPYYKGVVGVMLYGGDDGQWGHWARSGVLNHGDYSLAGVNAFRKWLEKQYETEEAFQSAWKDTEVTFATARVPSIAERRVAESVFLDPQKHKPVMDYLAFESQVKGVLIDRLGEAVKKNAGKPVLVGTYYQDAMYGRENNAYGEVPRLRSQYLDFFVSPLDYGAWRRPGWGGGTFSSCVDSLRLHNKLVLCELDLRTAVSRYTSDYYDYNILGRLENREMFDAVNRRETGIAAAYGMGQWYYTMAGGSFYADFAREGVAESIQAVKRVQAEPTVNIQPKVAVFADGVTNQAISRAYQNQLLYPSLNMTRSSLFLSGVTPAIYGLEDLMDPQLPEFEVMVFLNAWYLSEEQVSFIQENLAKEGRTLVFVHTAGLVRETGVDAKNITQLTGIEVSLGETFEDLSVVAESGVRAPFDQLWPRQGTAYETLRGLRLAIEDEKVEVLGRYADSGEVANALKDRGDHRVVLVASPGGLGPDLFHAIVADVGIPPVAEAGNVVVCRGNVLSMHGVQGGKVQVRLPETATVRDMLTGEIVAETVETFSVELPRQQTRNFYLTK